jgi:hypothetical protein
MALAVIVPADFLRFTSPNFERLYERCVGFLMREKEKVGFSPFLYPDTSSFFVVVTL